MHGARKQPENLRGNVVLTIGYEGATIQDFIATLSLLDVELLIDIRAVPVSRRKGFSKTALSQHLNMAGVDYLHLKALGDPKPGREAARRGDIQAFESIFRAHMETADAQAALQIALDACEDSRVCLLCYERSHSACHRSIVAMEMAAKDEVQIQHVGVRHGISDTLEANGSRN